MSSARNVKKVESSRRVGKARSGYNKGTIRGDLRYLVVSKDVRRHRLISIDYITALPCHGRGRGFNSHRLLPACYLRPRSCHDLADSALAFPSWHRLWCLKNTLPRIVLPQRSQVLTTNACLRKASNPPASSLPALGARS